MKYLLILNKFELSKERLENKIRTKLNDAKFYEDNGFMLESYKDINEILYFVVILN